MTFKSYRQQSRDFGWGTNDDSMNLEQINCGSLLRIADAMELVAKRHAELVDENKWLKETKKIKDEALQISERRAAARLGRVHKLQKQIELLKIKLTEERVKFGLKDNA